MNNQKLMSTLLLLCILAGISGCASNKTNEEIPLWTTYETIEAVYPKSEYIARIGYAKDSVSAVIFAESELGSYFSHTVHSVTEGQEVMTDAKAENGSEVTSVSRSIKRTVTVESLNQLFDVRKTDSWYNRSKKQYVCCAYINRADAWKLYEGKIKASEDAFLTAYNRAVSEKDTIKKISLFKICEPAADEFLEKLDLANLILPDSSKKFDSNRKLADSMKIEKQNAKINSVFYVKSQVADTEQLISRVSQIIYSQGFTVVSSDKDAVYEVQISIDYGKSVFTDTTTLNPILSINIKSKITGQNIFSYKRNLPKQSGFTAAEKLLLRKTLASAEDEIHLSFAGEFEKLWK